MPIIQLFTFLIRLVTYLEVNYLILLIIVEIFNLCLLSFSNTLNTILDVKEQIDRS